MPEKNYDVVCFGEVLWDILPSGPLPGGAPMNVAYHLKKLGHHPALVTRIGQDEWGEKLVSLFQANGISTLFFQKDERLSTGLVYAHPNEHHEVSYDIVKPAAWDHIQWQEDFHELLAGASVFLFGSLGARTEVSRATLSRLLDNAGTKVFDVNLRPPHYERQDIEYLLRKSDIVKLNEHELELVSSWYGKGHSTREQIRILEGKYALETVIVTLGARGAVISFGGRISEHPGFPVKVADTIGSGDAFLAGFIHLLLNGSSSEQVISFSCAMGAFMATHRGACPQYQPAEVLQLMQNVKTENRLV